ncbi:phospho-N-acetylmuramoyl-pentapeptide-transferase [Gloeocapsa sp. PCC 73106]|uniref:phospho-N-acetylmuramoyl-pentapeptide- transferase n=1 Tax=Gloeocapsa sp. PCC 73106 TaxID=102232 RepID=UPI0002AC66E4|nr:phospho-N-acetylmuramoyl-pentapeptide-transferase [Gloeocapsa sp. PCC 73106]ELS00012.1 Phospho-N-acetylmuramoyl-pentapeptide-transferase [Gloeocapsa sp. PCC 73106]
MNIKSLTTPSGVTLLILLALGLGLVAIILPLTTITLYSLLASAVISAGLGYLVVPILSKLKAGQIIQTDGPPTHQQKAGTPTMGGIFFIPVAIIVSLIIAPTTPELIALSLVTLGYGLIGWLDDWQILRQKSNKGISPSLKLFLQISFALIFCIWMFITQPETITNVALPGNILLGLGLGFWPLAIFVMTAESNATNLTDGVDGLAGGTGAIAFLAMGLILRESHPDLSIFALSFTGACFGFLVHNRHKATVFMGDTGSLALGGALGALGLLGSQLWALFIVSGLFFLESLSVIAQVTYYKATKGPDGQGKRLLKMAPLHHHLELSGWQETQVVGIFYLVNFILALLVINFS